MNSTPVLTYRLCVTGRTPLPGAGGSSPRWREQFKSPHWPMLITNRKENSELCSTPLIQVLWYECGHTSSCPVWGCSLSWWNRSPWKLFPLDQVLKICLYVSSTTWPWISMVSCLKGTATQGLSHKITVILLIIILSFISETFSLLSISSAFHRPNLPPLAMFCPVTEHFMIDALLYLKHDISYRAKKAVKGTLWLYPTEAEECQI